MVDSHKYFREHYLTIIGCAPHKYPLLKIRPLEKIFAQKIETCYISTTGLDGLTAEPHMETLLQHLIEMDGPSDVAYDPLIEISPPPRTPRSPHELLTAKAKSAVFELSHGMEATLDEDEESEARSIFHAYTQNDHLQAKKGIQVQAQINHVTKPGVILKLAALMSEYDYEVVRDAEQMRTYVTNRLLEESDPKMPASQRLQALKALGSITEVGLFTERTEITVHTMPMENLEAELHKRLITLLPEEYTDVTPC